MSQEKKSPLRGKLSTLQTGLLLDQLAAGVAEEEPLDEIFRALADDLTDRKLQAVATHLAEQFEQGADMETATASLSTVLPAHMRRALAIGTKSGNLSGILAGLSESELARKRMQRGLRSALAYPVLVLTILSLILLFFSLTVTPYFADIYDDFELDLPSLTLFVLSASEALPRFFLILSVFVLIVAFVGFFFANTRFLHWVRTSLPLLGRAWMWSGQHEFATLMATLTHQQVPTPEALACTAESLRDRNLAWAASQVSAKCEQGTSLSQSLRESIHFDPMLTSLTEWGETHQALSRSLREAADTYEMQMQLYVHFLHRIIPPLMLTFVATTLFLLVASLMIPLVLLINGLTG